MVEADCSVVLGGLMLVNSVYPNAESQQLPLGLCVRCPTAKLALADKDAMGVKKKKETHLTLTAVKQS